MWKTYNLNKLKYKLLQNNEVLSFFKYKIRVIILFMDVLPFKLLDISKLSCFKLALLWKFFLYTVNIYISYKLKVAIEYRVLTKYRLGEWVGSEGGCFILFYK